MTVDGAGSKWTISIDLDIGNNGAGALNITGGGLVSVDETLTIDWYGDGFINMVTGGMLALLGDADVSLTRFLDLVDGTGPIRYWDDELSDWANITGANFGDDYTLEYLTEGDLTGFTLLTVFAPGPAADFDNDGDVDGDDFLIWQTGFGVDDSGDADNDTDTDGDDFLVWQD